MRKFLFFLFVYLLQSFTGAFAQDVVETELVTQPVAVSLKIGCFSYDEVLRTMPDYSAAQKTLQDLRAQYDEEMKNAETEFNEKYEAFLEAQSAMAKVIREKRQSELQTMMERNVAFKEESARLMLQAEDDAMRPLYDKIAAALNVIGTERGFALIVNTDSNSCPFINPAMAEDITTLLIDVLK